MDVFCRPAGQAKACACKATCAYWPRGGPAKSYHYESKDSLSSLNVPKSINIHCNNAVSPAADKNAARIPSADSNASAGAGRAVGRVPDLRAGV
jgi:hypothetical protein